MLIIYGGSFNPPTKAHLELVNIIKYNFKGAKIVIVPVSNKNYTWKTNLASDEDRLQMLKLEFPDLLISDYEMKNKEYQGTYKLLSDFKEYDDDIYFLIGSDNLVQMPLWLNFEKLIKEFKFIVVKRPTDDIDFTKFGSYKENFKVIEMHNEISATKVRENVEKHKDWLSLDVYNYIKKHKLYEV